MSIPEKGYQRRSDSLERDEADFVRVYAEQFEEFRCRREEKEPADRSRGSYSPRPVSRDNRRRRRPRSPTPHSREKVARTIPDPGPAQGNILDSIPQASKALLQAQLDLAIDIDESGQILNLVVPALAAEKHPSPLFR